MDTCLNVKTVNRYSEWRKRSASWQAGSCHGNGASQILSKGIKKASSQASLQITFLLRRIRDSAQEKNKEFGNMLQCNVYVWGK